VGIIRDNFFDFLCVVLLKYWDVGAASSGKVNVTTEFRDEEGDWHGDWHGDGVEDGDDEDGEEKSDGEEGFSVGVRWEDVSLGMWQRNFLEDSTVSEIERFEVISCDSSI
jgi:hypothetical protein